MRSKVARWISRSADKACRLSRKIFCCRFRCPISISTQQPHTTSFACKEYRLASATSWGKCDSICDQRGRARTMAPRLTHIFGSWGTAPDMGRYRVRSLRSILWLLLSAAVQIPHAATFDIDNDGTTTSLKHGLVLVMVLTTLIAVLDYCRGWVVRRTR